MIQITKTGATFLGAVILVGFILVGLGLWFQSQELAQLRVSVNQLSVKPTPAPVVVPTVEPSATPSASVTRISKPASVTKPLTK